MPSPTLIYSTFTFGEITCWIISLGDSPVHLTFSPERHEMAQQWLRKQFGPACIIHNSDSLEFAGLLADFFKGRRRKFPQQVGSPFVEKATLFQNHVWESIAKIPYGETKTYGEIAQALGNPGAARAVGQACNANPLALIVPCHRVTAAAGLGGFAGGCAVKRYLLHLEQQTVRQKTKTRL